METTRRYSFSFLPRDVVHAFVAELPLQVTKAERPSARGWAKSCDAKQSYWCYTTTLDDANIQSELDRNWNYFDTRKSAVQSIDDVRNRISDFMCLNWFGDFDLTPAFKALAEQVDRKVS